MKFLWLISLCCFFGATPAFTSPANIAKHDLAGQHEHKSHLNRDLDNVGEAFPAMINALEVMQSLFWNGSSSRWPTGIDWTRAVLNTHMSATLSTMAEYQASTYEMVIGKYFSQVAAYYNRENITALVQEKYDDKQWVILEWLEAIKFINLYSLINSSFSGKQYVPEFGRRATVFWDMASQGYDTTLCGGGMLWDDQLAPYKNAITNQLFVASSIGMYLYFPGDDFTSTHDQKYLKAAITEYEWLSNSNMTNAQGLYVDGFHVTNWTSPTSIGTGKCDARDESVYTYNQGVLLSGLRGLWDATGQSSYLYDGYNLVQNVIAATGWYQDRTTSSTWAGIGSDGILQDLCDVDGTCSQDAQGFKAVFFHHLTLFCLPLAMEIAETSSTVFNATTTEAQNHQVKCDGYLTWIKHNAQAAYGTRNQSGVYGMWWDVPSPDRPHQPLGASDYRNKGIPQNKIWRLPSDPAVSQIGMTPVSNVSTLDPNQRGRGRTVETQSGGLAVLRSLVQAQEG